MVGFEIQALTSAGQVCDSTPLHRHLKKKKKESFMLVILPVLWYIISRPACDSKDLSNMYNRTEVDWKFIRVSVSASEVLFGISVQNQKCHVASL